MSGLSKNTDSSVIPKKSLSRIMRDKRMIQLHPLHKDRIYVIHDPDDVRITRACIIGPEGTPYENGMYLFELTFPNNYPYSPPKAVYYTNDGDRRMHPNFYTSGKVCVSIIGTWSGPGWTSCQSLSSVLLTFQSLMTENPLWQEPGFDGEKTTRNNNYNRAIEHENIRIGILKMIKSPPKGFACFRDIMKAHLVAHEKQIIKFCDDRMNLNSTNVSSPHIYHFNVDLDYTNLKEKLQKFYQSQKLCKLPVKLEKDLAKALELIPSEYTTLKEVAMACKGSINTELTWLLTFLDIRGQIERNVKGEIKKIGY